MIINFNYYASRQQDNGTYLVYNLYAKLAPVEFQDLGTVSRTIQIGLPANPAVFVYANMADAYAAFLVDQVSQLIDVLSSYFGITATLGVPLVFSQETKDAIDAAKAPVAVSSMLTKSLNTAYQASDTARPFDLAIAVDIATSLSLTSGQSGTVFLDICASSGFASGVTTVDEFTASNTGTLIVGLALGQTVTAKLRGDNIPAGYYWRIRTVNNTGIPTFTFKRCRETLR